MDVQATGATLVSPALPAFPALQAVAPVGPRAISAQPLRVAPASAVADAGTGGGSDIGTSPGLASLPATASDAEKAAAHALADRSEGDKSLSSSVAKLFNEREADVEVSFRVDPGADQVVTVFTDRQTGKTIVQFPSETLVALAQFFNKLGGGLLDKKV